MSSDGEKAPCLLAPELERPLHAFVPVFPLTAEHERVEMRSARDVNLGAIYISRIIAAQERNQSRHFLHRSEPARRCCGNAGFEDSPRHGLHFFCFNQTRENGVASHPVAGELERDVAGQT